ncbi:hypothetical protein Vretimale_9005 [Volvox reticuliferus]|uniref:Uncharacterized protein n=1 Tax=Volvox reticuliferus TaxID=1737510 RepID=A0A8J4GCY3_9CHLO|nr:hypothetical protein Vretimale_9005 [Volvox reticuliferus]
MFTLRIRSIQVTPDKGDAGVIAGKLGTRCTIHRHALSPRKTPHLRGSTRVDGIGKDAVDGWLDLTKLVAGSGGTKTPYEEFASAIGRDVYVDIAGWHLYLRDMGAGIPGGSLKMSQALAQQLGPQLTRGLREPDVEALLKKVPVKLGGGKLKEKRAAAMRGSLLTRALELIREKLW